MWCHISAAVAFLAVADALMTLRPMQALEDPLAHMMPGADRFHRMPMTWRRQQLERIYSHVYDARATQQQSGRRHLVEIHVDERSLFTLECLENAGDESMIAEDFRMGDSVATKAQVAAMRRCQCSGSVVGDEGSIAEMTLCGRVTYAGFCTFC